MLKIVVAMLFLSSCLFAQANNGSNEFSSIDGADWQRFDEDIKLGYVVGYADAETGAHMLVGFFCSWQIKADSEAAKICTADANSLNFGGIAVRQLRDGMDTFYKDFRNRQVPLSMAMHLVRDQINGRPAEDIEKELTAWRQCHADSSKCSTPTGVTKQPPAPAKQR